MHSLARDIPIFLLSFLVGVFFASFSFLPSWIVFALFLFSFIFFFAWSVEQSRRLFVVSIILFGLSFGVLRFTVWHDAPLDPILASRIGTPVILTGVVIDEPDVREGKTHLSIALETLGEASASQVVSGTLLAFVDRYPEYRYGDRLVLRGKLSAPTVFAEADGRVFDYPSYLRTKGIRYQMSFAKTEHIGSGEGNSIKSTLFAVKQKFQSTLQGVLPEPHSALLSGLLLGGKQSLGSEWLDRFRVAGIVHIVVLSGYNMTIVSEWLVVGFRFLGFFGSIAMGALGIVLFAVMTGGGATVVRAAILALLVLLARVTGRVSEMGRALLFAGALMVLVNPSILLFDPSFQLSFLASLGLVFIAPLLAARFSLWKTRPFLHEVLISTLATQIMVLPLLLYQTGMFSVVALPANLLVLPLIPMTMLFGFVAGVLSLLVPALGPIVGYPAYMLLAYILTIAGSASQVPYAAINVHISAAMVVLLYVGLFLFLFMKRQSGPISAHPLEAALLHARSPE